MDPIDSHRRVLVVEDCRDTRETLQFLLNLWGHDVRVARDAGSALAVAEAFQPDVALVDIGLPGPDGFSVALRLKDLSGSQIPMLIAATGYDGSFIRKRCRQVGFDCFLPKPYDLVMLRELLATSREVVPG
jgi:two-component system, chemotaxis family, CheB/CheR fusion protein